MGAEAERSMMTRQMGEAMEYTVQTGFRKQILGTGRKPGNEKKVGQVEEKGRNEPQGTQTA